MRVERVLQAVVKAEEARLEGDRQVDALKNEEREKNKYRINN